MFGSRVVNVWLWRRINLVLAVARCVKPLNWSRLSVGQFNKINYLKFIRDMKVKNKLTVGACCCCSAGRQETNFNQVKLQCFWTQLKESNSFLYSDSLLPPPPPSSPGLPPSFSFPPLSDHLSTCLSECQHSV